MKPHEAPLLTGLLEQVSRSFYKTLWILPRPVRTQIGLAYLLARTSDTIADTGLVEVDQRRIALRQLAQRIEGRREAPVEFGALASLQGSPAERTLLERADAICALLDDYSPADQERIRSVLRTIISGQDLDLARFLGASPKKIVALQSDVELDEYTYRVAGCVGEFWTDICEAHVGLKPVGVDPAEFRKLGMRFGKGLQLVNILRDLPHDLRQGRCYLPAPRLSMARLDPEDLLDATNEPRFRQLYHSYLDTALDHLRAGWRYTNSIPLGCLRLRLACAWPILIGVKTLSLLRTENVLEAGRRIKIPRRVVNGILLRTIIRLPARAAWAGLFGALNGGK